MDLSLKPPADSSVLDELRQAIESADRCLALARREAARIDAALRRASSGEPNIEQQMLENVRRRRELLTLFELPPVSLEVVDPPARELQPAAPPSREEKSVPEAVPEETFLTEHLAGV